MPVTESFNSPLSLLIPGGDLYISNLWYITTITNVWMHECMYADIHACI